jgi:hypothetical protein
MDPAGAVAVPISQVTTFNASTTKEFLMKVKHLILTLVIVWCVSPAAAIAQDDGNWDFELAPLYFWGINIDGDLGIRGRTAEASVDFSDIWDSLESVFTVRFGMLYKDKFGFLIDYNYLDLGTESQKDVVDIEVGFKSSILNAGATYRFLNGRHTIDGLAGIRYIKLEADVALTNLGVSLDGDQDWVDPVVGVRYGFQIADMWALRLYGDIGGFGVSSEFTWQGLGLIDFQPWKHVAFVAGYRAIGVDYSTGSGRDRFIFDAITHGPVIGLDIRF